jgi:hypothetical protein
MKGDLIQQLSDPETKATLKEADVIMGVDVRNPDNSSIFYGKATLERISKGSGGRTLGVARVPVDFETDDLEALAAFCVHEKGSCCYVGQGDSGEPTINPEFN